MNQPLLQRDIRLTFTVRVTVEEPTLEVEQRYMQRHMPRLSAAQGEPDPGEVEHLAWIRRMLDVLLADDQARQAFLITRAFDALPGHTGRWYEVAGLDEQMDLPEWLAPLRAHMDPADRALFDEFAQHDADVIYTVAVALEQIDHATTAQRVGVAIDVMEPPTAAATHNAE